MKPTQSLEDNVHNHNDNHHNSDNNDENNLEVIIEKQQNKKEDLNIDYSPLSIPTINSCLSLNNNTITTSSTSTFVDNNNNLNDNLNNNNTINGNNSDINKNEPLQSLHVDNYTKDNIDNTIDNTIDNNTIKNTIIIHYNSLQNILSKYSIDMNEYVNLQDVQKGDEEIHEMIYCKGMKHLLYLEILFWLLVIITFGILLLICKWFVTLKTFLTHKFTKSYCNATCVIVKSKITNDLTVCNLQNGFIIVNKKNGMFRVVKSLQNSLQNILQNSLQEWKIEECDVIEVKYFIFRYVLFIYDPNMDNFRRVHYNTVLPYMSIYKQSEIENIHFNNHTTTTSNNDNNTLQKTDNTQQSIDNTHNHHSLIVDNNTQQQLQNNNIQNERELKKLLFGKNLIKTPMKNILFLLLDEILHPFYLFQIGSVIIWCVEDYYEYGICIAVISTISALLSLYETKSNMNKLREMTSYECKVNRILYHYNNNYVNDHVENHVENQHVENTNNANTTNNTTTTIHVEQVSSTDLVPGDLIEIENEMQLPCDCILLHGQAILNESMLTGESVPVKKIPLPKSHLTTDTYNSKKDKSNTLYAGTQVIMTKPSSSSTNKVIGLVINTGFNTTKGKLILTILFPKPNQFKFYRDSLKFLFVLLIVGMIGITASFINLLSLGAAIEVAIILCIDLLTIVVPPALPIAMSTTTSFAIERMKKNKVFCISPPRVNVSGIIKLIVFDKTNTLTRDGLDLLGISTIDLNNGTFNSFIKDTDLLKELTNDNYFMIGMASCHNLSFLNNKLVGDPLEIKIFESTKWILKENNDSNIPILLIPPNLNNNNTINGSNLVNHSFYSNTTNNTAINNNLTNNLLNNSLNNNENIEMIDLNNNSSIYGIVKVFDFKSSLQRMSVIIKNLKTNEYFCFVKGSAEILKTLQKKDTNLNLEEYSNKLYNYSHKGYRVLALAFKKLNLFYKNHNSINSINITETITAETNNNLNNKITNIEDNIINEQLIIESINRNEIESNLEILGFICMENKLKNDTPMVIKNLIKSNMKCVMCTGDNPFTAICVARKCNLIDKTKTIYLSEFCNSNYNTTKLSNNDSITNEEEDLYKNICWRNVDSDEILTTREMLQKDFTKDHFELAVIGDIFDYLLQLHYNNNTNITTIPHENNTTTTSIIDNNTTTIDNNHHVTTIQQQQHNVTNNLFHLKKEQLSLLHILLSSCNIYARFSPLGKMKVIEEYQKLNYITCMCGDGANDVEALRSAHVGISLSEAEASIAAPFTSLRPTISSVLTVIREGRAALTSSFQMFRYISLYSLIQFFTIVNLFSLNSSFSNFQYLYVDMIIILPTVLLMTRTGASKTLKRERPLKTLISKMIFISLIGQIILSFLFILIIWFEMKLQIWFKPLIVEDDYFENLQSFENSLLFIMSTYCTLNTAIAMSISKPFKLPILTNNFPYLILIIFLYLFTSFILVLPCSWIRNTLKLVSFPLMYRLKILLYALIHLVLSYGFEYLLLLRVVKKMIGYCKVLNVLKVLCYLFGNVEVFRKGLIWCMEKRPLYRQLNEKLNIKKRNIVNENRSKNGKKKETLAINGSGGGDNVVNQNNNNSEMINDNIVIQNV
ncbi:hypothetical protein ABK040_007605 [Willaertia magna]